MSIQHCSGDHCVSSSYDGRVAIATPFRMFKGHNSQFLRGELYGREFKSSDEAHAAMRAHGYCVEFFPRSSTVIPTFAGIESQERQARFDALYRYWKHLSKRGDIHAKCVRAHLVRMAKAVGIFHPVARHILKSEVEPKET